MKRFKWESGSPRMQLVSNEKIWARNIKFEWKFLAKLIHQQDLRRFCGTIMLNRAEFTLTVDLLATWKVHQLALSSFHKRWLIRGDLDGRDKMRFLAHHRQLVRSPILALWDRAEYLGRRACGEWYQLISLLWEQYTWLQVVLAKKPHKLKRLVAARTGARRSCSLAQPAMLLLLLLLWWIDF